MTDFSKVWNAAVRRAGDILRELLFPVRCAGCGKTDGTLDSDRMLCPDCAKNWEAAALSVCPACGKTQMFCRCSVSAAGRSISGYYHAVPYRSEPVRTMLFRVKRKPDIRTVRFLARQTALLCELAVQESGKPRDSFVLTAPPRTKRKARETGTDQAVLLAKETAYLTGIPYVRVLERSENGQEQKTLDAAGRLTNAEESFCIRNGCETEIKRKNVLLADDIITTGATLGVCASVLLDAGAEAVFSVTAAKTYGKTKE